MWDNRCAWMQARLPLMAGGELVGPDRRRIERHLLVCRNCRERLAGLREAVDALRTAAELPPVMPGRPSVWPALARQIQESRRPVAPLAWSFLQPRVAWISTAAATVGLLLASVWMLQPSRPARAPRVTQASAHPPVTSPVRQPAAAPASIHVAEAAPRPRPQSRKAESRPRDAGSASEKTPATRLVSEPDRSSVPQPTDTRDTQ